MTKSDQQRRGDESMLYVVSYDIPDDRRRTRVHSALTGFGTWVQYSVFECFLDRKQRVLLEARLLKEIHQQQDLWPLWNLYAESRSTRPRRSPKRGHNISVVTPIVVRGTQW